MLIQNYCLTLHSDLIKFSLKIVNSYKSSLSKIKKNTKEFVAIYFILKSNKLVKII